MPCPAHLSPCLPHMHNNNTHTHTHTEREREHIVLADQKPNQCLPHTLLTRLSRIIRHREMKWDLALTVFVILLATAISSKLVLFSRTESSISSWFTLQKWNPYIHICQSQLATHVSSVRLSWTLSSSGWNMFRNPSLKMLTLSLENKSNGSMGSRDVVILIIICACKRRFMMVWKTGSVDSYQDSSHESEFLWWHVY